VLAYLRDPANAAKLGIDTHRIVMIRSQYGRLGDAHTAANDHALLIGAILISAGDMGRLGDAPRDRV
jgi:hypothetical protein